LVGRPTEISKPYNLLWAPFGTSWQRNEEITWIKQPLQVENCIWSWICFEAASS
jgi:hypothetical protein